MIRRLVVSTACLIVLSLALSGPILAQNLPPAPEASSSAQSPASQRGESGGALEPYLITWLLPAFGIIGAIACVVADRRLRSLSR